MATPSSPTLQSKSFLNNPRLPSNDSPKPSTFQKERSTSSLPPTLVKACSSPVKTTLPCESSLHQKNTTSSPQNLKSWSNLKEKKKNPRRLQPQPSRVPENAPPQPT